LASLADGSTVLDRAIQEHNILAISRVYLNISFQGLGEMLNVSSEKAELTCSSMIAEGRLDAYIDQIDGYIFFRNGNTFQDFDQSVSNLLNQLETTYSDIQQLS
jgi:COP9 signalosome complex subunit 4